MLVVGAFTRTLESEGVWREEGTGSQQEQGLGGGSQAVDIVSEPLIFQHLFLS